MKIAVVLGTRPEIIKMAPVIRELEKRQASYFILHTGQHYSYNLDKVFFEQLGLPLSKYNLEVGSGSNAEQTGKILIGVEKVLLEEQPDIVLVEGDTNSVLAGALAATKLHIRVGHVEAGLRTHNIYSPWPEEINRQLTGRIASYHFAPTEEAAMNLMKGTITDGVFSCDNVKIEGLNKKHSGDITLGFRAEDASIVKSKGAIKAAAFSMELLGDMTMVSVKAGGDLISIKSDKNYYAKIGSTVMASVPANLCLLFSSKTGKLLKN